VVQRATAEQAGDALPLDGVQPILGRDALLELQGRAVAVRVDRAVADYAVRIARATRDAPGLSQGAGPRGAIALVRVARAAALLEGRDFTIPDDVKRFALPALRHRVMLAPDAQLDGRQIDEILQDLVERTDAPRA
jgi:MoxR-like ATPase